VWQYEKCDTSTIAGYGYDLIVNQRVDVLLAPPCPQADIAATLGTTYNIPVLLYGNTMESKCVSVNLGGWPMAPNFARPSWDYHKQRENAFITIAIHILLLPINSGNFSVTQY
jgi:hypothetical protein